MNNLKINRANIVDLEEEEVGEEKVEEAVEKDGIIVKEITGKDKTKDKETIAQLQATQVPVQVDKKRDSESKSKKNRKRN